MNEETEKMLSNLDNKIYVEKKKLVATFYEDKKIQLVSVDMEEDEHILVDFQNGYVVVYGIKGEERKTKFVCKGTYFISLWC